MKGKNEMEKNEMIVKPKNFCVRYIVLAVVMFFLG